MFNLELFLHSFLLLKIRVFAVIELGKHPVALNHVINQIKRFQ